MAKTLVYQIYAPSWGSFREMERHLYRIQSMDIDYVWVGPIYPSPWHDNGYDAKDYRDINTAFGTMEDFDNFVKTAHRLGMKVVIDLILNHTSTKHRWFIKNSEYYCWSSDKRPGWHNLFDGGSCWKYDAAKNLHYLHLFHEEQADLNWFPAGRLNQTLVEEFQEIVRVWTEEHSIDGFRLDFPQAINKDITRETFEFADLLQGSRTSRVISAIFSGEHIPFLMMECFDPTYGKIVEYYADTTPVDCVANVLVKDAIKGGWNNLTRVIRDSSYDSAYMLELESHDSPRFPSRVDAGPEEILWAMFSSNAQAICLYQGQELGLKNPTKKVLTDEQMMKLDVETAMRYIKGEDINALRPISRANARVPLPLYEYRMQVADPASIYNLTRTWIDRWKQA